MAHSPAALYHRVSTTDQDPTAPLAILRKAAREGGHDDPWELTETGSGSRRDRPLLNKLLNEVRARRIRVVYVWRLDRFGRSALDLLTMLYDFERSGARFIALNDKLDIRPGSHDPTSRLMLTMLSAVAEFERQIIRERTRMGLARARERGRIGGRPPKVARPEPKQVRDARALGLSWERTAKLVGSTPYLCRRALAAL